VFADHDDDGHDALESAIPARDDLAAVKGIGPATADAMILLALGRPSYPVDRPTYRVLVRHGWIDSTTSYEEARDSIVDRAMSMADGSDEAAALDLAALGHAMAELGRQFCRARAPLCAGCPLEHLLPEGGPRDGDA
jgi:endonuclease-3 related protein